MYFVTRSVISIPNQFKHLLASSVYGSTDSKHRAMDTDMDYVSYPWDSKKLATGKKFVKILYYEDVNGFKLQLNSWFYL